MQERRRKDDERIDAIHEAVTGMKVLVEQTHEALFGNGRPGLKSEFDHFKGGLAVFKWIAGAGGLTSLGLLIKSLVDNV